jgi:ComF family protein
VEACSALGNYGDLLQRLVIQLKGHRNESLALQLGQLLGQRLKELPWSRNLEAIVPVPAHWSKQLQKGFHGAAVIGEGIRRELRLDWLPRAVRSTRRTAKQGMLENSERFRNVAGAFEVTHPDRVAGRNLLIVDDVLTSGATMTAVCEALREADAGPMYAAVLARGVRSAS